jgi:ribosome biogenesis protein Nip4
LYYKKGRVTHPFSSVQKCGEDDLLIFQRFLEYISSSFVLKECDVICKYSREKTEYYCMRRECQELEKKVLNIGIIPYSIFFYLGKGNKNDFEPSLQLGWEITLEYKKRNLIPPHTVILRGYDAEKFTYGKNVRLRDNVKEYGVVLVLTDKKEFLGWGQVSKRLLYPLIDIGWYLRKGG